MPSPLQIFLLVTCDSLCKIEKQPCDNEKLSNYTDGKLQEYIWCSHIVLDIKHYGSTYIARETELRQWLALSNNCYKHARRKFLF